MSKPSLPQVRMFGICDDCGQVKKVVNYQQEGTPILLWLDDTCARKRGLTRGEPAKDNFVWGAAK